VGASFFDGRGAGPKRRRGRARQRGPQLKGPEEIAAAAFRRVDRKIRPSLRRLTHRSVFLRQLDTLFLSYKLGHVSAEQAASLAHVFTPTDSFSLVAPASVASAVALPDGKVPIVVDARDAHARMVVHGVAQFHGLASESHSVDGQRLTFVWLVHRSHSLSLSDYLEHLLERRKAVPSASPPPPVQGAVDTDVDADHADDAMLESFVVL